jgi:hypothetical protein
MGNPLRSLSGLHKELTVRQIIQHFGFFASDAALEDKILAFFTQRATLALSNGFEQGTRDGGNKRRDRK